MSKLEAYSLRIKDKANYLNFIL